jgi:hypothetical protein
VFFFYGPVKYMEDHSSTIRQEWITALNSRGLSQITSVLLEAFKPLSFLSAQFIHTGTPLLRLVLPEQQIEAAGSLLEDSGELQNFVDSLQVKE